MIVTLTDVKFRGPSVLHVVRIGKQRTSVRLDDEFWTAFEEIAERENCSIHELCVMINERRGHYGLTAAIRMFILSYFRSFVPRGCETKSPDRILETATYLDA